MTASLPVARKAEPRWTLGFVLAVPFGIAILWVPALLAVLFSRMVDCFGPEDVCRGGWEAAIAEGNVLLEVAAGLTVLAVLAIAFGRRRVPAILFVASVAVLILSVTPRPIAADWIPGYLYVLWPGLVILALASAGQVVDWTRWHRRGGAESARMSP